VAAALAALAALAGSHVSAAAEKWSFDFGGRLASRFVATSYPENSVFRDLIGSSSEDLGVDGRLTFGATRGRWDLKADYQLIALYGDTVEATRQFPPELLVLSPRLPLDDRRLFDLTHVFTDDGKLAVLQRLDRLSAGHTTEKSVLRFGRQAITWGNVQI